MSMLCDVYFLFCMSVLSFYLPAVPLNVVVVVVILGSTIPQHHNNIHLHLLLLLLLFLFLPFSILFIPFITFSYFHLFCIQTDKFAPIMLCFCYFICLSCFVLVKPFFITFSVMFPFYQFSSICFFLILFLHFICPFLSLAPIP